MLKTLICLTIAALCLGTHTAHAVDEPPLRLARHLLRQQNPDAAITEYKRFLYFHPDAARLNRVHYEIGLAYRAQDRWEHAVTHLRTAILLTPDSETRSEYRLQLAVTLIASQNYDLARLELIKVTLQTPSAQLYRRALFLQAVADIYQFRWEDAQDALRNYTTDAVLTEQLKAAAEMPQKSAGLAQRLSTFLPGAGQAYAGEWTDALNALALNGVFAFLTIDAALQANYMDATLWGVLIFWRYYRGNTYRAADAVRHYNQKQSEHAAEAILQRLHEIARRQPK